MRRLIATSSSAEQLPVPPPGTRPTSGPTATSRRPLNCSREAALKAEDLVAGSVALQAGFIDFAAFRAGLEQCAAGRAPDLVSALERSGRLDAAAAARTRAAVADAISRHGDAEKALVYVSTQANLPVPLASPRLPPQTLPLPSGLIVLGEALGRGAAGSVVAAREANSGRALAIKFLSVGRDSPNQVARFRNEARIGALLEHPNVCPTYGLGEDDGHLFLVMKHVHGRTLQEILRELRDELPGAAQRWPLTRRLEVFTQVAQGVAYAHSRGVIHRDLKPANVMLGDHGEVLVMDWGLAKVIGDPEDAFKDLDEVLTRSGTVMGTPHYMPPELLRGETRAAGFPSDVYGLGAILFELISLHTPHRAQSLIELIAVAHQRADLRRHVPAVDPELEQIVLRAIEPDPADRFPTVGELLAALRRFLAGLPGRGRAPVRAQLLATGLVTAALGAALGLVLAPSAPPASPTPSASASAREAALLQAARAGERLAEVLRYQRMSEMLAPQELALTEHVRQAGAEIQAALRAAGEAVPEQRPAWLLLEGRLHLALFAYEEARGCAREARRLDPTAATAWSLEGRAHLEQALGSLVDPERDWTEPLERARECYGRAEEMGQAPELAFQLFDALARGEHDTLKERVSQSLKAVPDPAFAFLAVALLQVSGTFTPEEMQRELTEVFLIHPRYVPALVVGGAEALRLRQPTEALVFFDAALRARPRQATAHLLRGQCLDALGRFEEAEAAFGSLVELRPQSIIGWTLRGVAAGNSGDAVQAEAHLRRAAAIEARNAQDYLNRAQAWMHLEEPARMEADVEAALARGSELYPSGRANAWSWLGSARLERKDATGALAAFESAIALDAESAPPHRGRGASLEELGDALEAAHAFEETLRLDPNQSQADLLRSKILQALGRPSRY